VRRAEHGDRCALEWLLGQLLGIQGDLDRDLLEVGVAKFLGIRADGQDHVFREEVELFGLDPPLPVP
jgi:hypothetical protein